MKKLAIFSLLLCVFVLSACSSHSTPQKEKTKPVYHPTTFTKKATKQLTYKTTVQLVDKKDSQHFTDTQTKGVVRPNQRIRITVRVTNVSKKPFKFGGNFCDSSLTTSLSKGNKEISGSGAVTLPGCFQIYSDYTLGAGETLSSSATFDLKDVPLGTYQLTSQYGHTKVSFPLIISKKTK